MKVFISWSESRSKAMAKALKDWIPDVIQSCEPWISSEDIDPGARWSSDLAKQLEQTEFGIICLTPENTNAPWILFEAGAVSKKLNDETRLCPYLLGLGPTDIEGPLVQFQAAKADKADTWKLMHSINRAMGSGALAEERVNKAFNTYWPNLEESLNKISASAPESVEPKRPDEDKLDEILNLVREQSKIISGQLSPTKSAEDLQREAMREVIAASIQYPDLMDLLMRQSNGEQVDIRQILNLLADKPEIAKAFAKAIPLNESSENKPMVKKNRQTSRRTPKKK
jgi:hypothetical protein